MPNVDVSALSGAQRATATWAAAVTHALVRDEAAGRRPVRLTEPRLDTWTRFRGRLNNADLVELMFEDAAVLHRVPFDAAFLGEPLNGSVSHEIADALIQAIPSQLQLTPSIDYVAEQARYLGLPTRFARSDLHVVKPHQKVLELPGTGGQMAHHLVTSQKDLTLQDNFAVACTSWQELTLAGVVGLELGAPNTDFAHKIAINDLGKSDHPLRQRSFDFVVGLHPDKGGLFKVQDQLAIWFPTAKILLV
jgi:hypothetical protein